MELNICFVLSNSGYTVEEFEPVNRGHGDSMLEWRGIFFDNRGRQFVKGCLQ